MPCSPEQVVNALYLGALNRNPDPEGFKAAVELLKGDPEAIDALASGFYNSAERQGRDQGKLDHSQCGELELMLARLVGRGRRNGIVVDVGARGVERSNSYDLMSRFGWRGFLVEANPALDAEIRRGFAGTGFTLLNVAIGVQEGRLPFYLGSNDDVSSLARESASAWGDIRGVIEVPVRRLHGVLEELGLPQRFDLLSIDIEGLDVPVLNDLIDPFPLSARLHHHRGVLRVQDEDARRCRGVGPRQAGVRDGRAGARQPVSPEIVIPSPLALGQVRRTTSC